ncbi:hypothetical protein HK101_003773 [Irineochytrium annulatum]|nr:hypothetical protein HK101_003773 [Irineochytrium annulatum]
MLRAHGRSVSIGFSPAPMPGADSVTGSTRSRSRSESEGLMIVGGELVDEEEVVRMEVERASMAGSWSGSGSFLGGDGDDGEGSEEEDLRSLEEVVLGVLGDGRVGYR